MTDGSGQRGRPGQRGRAALRGLTWDHPRGYVVLDAVAAAGGGPPSPRTSDPGPPVRWERQPLEGFESRPLRTLADDYDLLVIDHPGLGEAVRDGALRPLDELFGGAELAGWEAVSTGRSYASYRLAGHQWALPLDAAAQVSVRRPDLMAEQPTTWEDACRAARGHRTAACLGGPHALLMFAAICVALGAPPAGSDDGFADPAAGATALAIMADLLAHADPRLSARNPVAVLDAMAAPAAADAPAYCPLVYGYLTYQRPRPGARPLAAFDAPSGGGAGPGAPGTGLTGPAGVIGSVLGGTGIAVTRSCDRPEAARAQIRRLLSEETQVRLYAELGGQSADRRAWRDPVADARSGGFYSATRRTVEQAWVRPRFAGYLEFQTTASAVLREGLIGGERHHLLLTRVNDLFREIRAEASTMAGPNEA